MPTKTEEIVMYNSPEAATYRTDIKGWVSRNGLYCGRDEDLDKAAADRIERVEARIRKLVEAAEWRDECLEAKDWCYRMKVAEWTPGGCKRWEKSYDHSIKILESAEASYQTALAAAKQGAADVAPTRCSLEGKGRAQLKDR